MKFLKILATPFIKIWNWIKQTAWVQPLLIVGCIFAVIFSIPYIAKGVDNMHKSSTDKMAFYKEDKNLISLKKANKGESEADKFLDSFLAAQEDWALAHKEDGDKQTENVKKFAKDYGEKFFFMFTGTNCEPCHKFAKGYKELKKHPKDYSLEGKFNFHNIIVDQKMSKGDKKLYKEKSAFQFLIENNATVFSSKFYDAGRFNKFYATNLTDNTTYLESVTKLATAQKTIEVPVIMVFDTTAKNDTSNIISQMFFELPGETNIEMAKSLSDAWNYKGDTFGRAKDINEK